MQTLNFESDHQLKVCTFIISYGKCVVKRKRGIMTDFNVTYNDSIPVMCGVKETAAHFGIAQHFARQLALTGKVKAVRAGNKILINQQSVTDYFNNCTLEVEEPKSTIQPIPVKLR